MDQKRLNRIGAVIVALLAVVVGLAIPFIYDREIETEANATLLIYFMTEDGMVSGSGVHLGDGLVMTAQHVLDITATPLAVFAFQERADALTMEESVIPCDISSIEFGDTEIDTAFLQCDVPEEVTTVEVCEDDQLIGTRNHMIVSFPAGRNKVIRYGNISGKESAGYVLYSFMVSAGSSGGPVFFKGCVVDVIVALYLDTGDSLAVGNIAMVKNYKEVQENGLSIFE